MHNWHAPPCSGVRAAPCAPLRALRHGYVRASRQRAIRANAEAAQQAEVVVIGSGIGGLCCAALLAHYGVDVTVCESHSIPGGAAHAWVQDGYHFESGPSLYSGMATRGQAANPIAHVLQAIGEPLKLLEYNSWNVLIPEGEFLTERLQEVMRPLSAAATMVPPAAIRADPAVALTTLGRFFPSLIQHGAKGLQLVGPYSRVLDGVVSDPFLRNWMDLLCFLLSGLPANGTIAAEVAFMFAEWYGRPGYQLEFPKGGSQAIINALVRGVKKRGGRVRLGAHVEEVLVAGGRAAGVRLRCGETIAASRAVVSNASLWDTLRLLPPGSAAASQLQQRAQGVPLNRSFMHLHLGFDATGLDGLELHHIVVNSWQGGVDAEQNVVLISIPSVIDPSMAPPGKHTLHAYLPATEPFSLWKGLERGSAAYEALKEERSQVLWRAVERIIPDIRQRTTIEMVGTPLTHKRFLRRHDGTYGPGIIAGQGTFPGPTTPLPGLLCCGDSTFPGIGVPAVAASGTIAANSLVPLRQHWRMLDALGL